MLKKYFKFKTLDESAHDFEALLQALQDEELAAEGRCQTEADIADLEEGRVAIPEGQEYPLYSYRKIPAEHWITGRAELEKGLLSIMEYTAEGMQALTFYSDIRCELSAIKFCNGPAKAERAKPTSKTHILLGKAYSTIRNKKGNAEKISAEELWSFLENNFREYGFDDYCAVSDNGEPALFYTKNNEEVKVTKRNFKNIVSQFNSGKLVLPIE